MSRAECHGHIILDGIDYKKAVAVHSGGVNQDVIKKRLEACRRQGITFYREGGDAMGVSAYAASIASRFGIDYRTPLFAIHKNGHYGSMFGRGFDTIEEYEQLIREVKEEGGDFIKIMITGIMDFHTYGRITGGALERPMIQDMVQAAHETGFAVMAHTNTADQIRWALEAGADTIEHGYYMNEKCLRLFSARRAVWVPTFAPVAQAGKSGLFPAEVISRILALHRENLRKAVSMGILVACGSDAGSFMVPPDTGCITEEKEMEEAVPLEMQARLQELVKQGTDEIRRRFARSKPAKEQ